MREGARVVLRERSPVPGFIAEQGRRGKGRCTMRSLQKYALPVILGGLLVAVQAEASEQRVTIRLDGKFCEFYLVDVAKSLKQVAGVKNVDLESVHGHVVVTMIAGQVNPGHLLA